MAWRSGHGNGKGSPRIEVLPADELPPATPSNTDRLDRRPDGRFAPSNTVARGKRLRPGARGHVSLDRSDPEVRPYAQWGRRYGTHRRAELARAHGGSISAGVGAIVESAATALWQSRYLAAKAAETGDADMMKRSADLGALARQHEMASWELAAKECAARPRRNAIQELQDEVTRDLERQRLEAERGT